MIAFDMSASASCAASKVVCTFLSCPTTFAGRHGVNGGLGVLTSFVSNVLLEKERLHGSDVRLVLFTSSYEEISRNFDKSLQHRTIHIVHW